MDLFGSAGLHSLVGLKLPFIMDTEMIYLSPFLREIFVFEKDGEWYTENVTHPKLSLDNLYCEKKWYDAYRIF
jgi:hypothetical protein